MAGTRGPDLHLLRYTDSGFTDGWLAADNHGSCCISWEFRLTGVSSVIVVSRWELPVVHDSRVVRVRAEGGPMSVFTTARGCAHSV